MTPRKRGSKKSMAPAPKAVMETRVFRSGNSYAVRLPKPLYSGGEGAVYVTRLAGGEILIAPKKKRRWPAGFLASFGTLPENFEAPARPSASSTDDERVAALFRDDE